MVKKIRPAPYKKHAFRGPHPEELQTMAWVRTSCLPPLGVLDMAQAAWGHQCRVEFCRHAKALILRETNPVRQKALKATLKRLLEQKRMAEWWINCRGVWTTRFLKEHRDG